MTAELPDGAAAGQPSPGPMVGVEIFDLDPRGFLTFDLRDILPLVGPVGRHLCWSILDLDATRAITVRRHLRELEDESGRSAAGVLVSWEELVHLGPEISQIIDGIFVGCRRPGHFPKGRLYEGDLYEPAELVIEALGSTYWRVSARRGAVLDALRGAFQNVRPAHEAP